MFKAMLEKKPATVLKAALNNFHDLPPKLFENLGAEGG